MPGQVIKAYLQSDTVDTTAAAIRAANPNMHWTTDNQVPPYLYQSLCTLLGLQSNPSDFPRHIVGAAGRNLAPPTFIQVCPYYFESVGHPQGFQFDVPGAEFARVRILFSFNRPVEPSNFDTLRMCEFRVRLLLDWTLRNEGPGITPGVPISYLAQDNTIVSTEQYSYFMCKWVKLDNEPNSSEIVSEYTVNYIRQYGQSIINIPL